MKHQVFEIQGTCVAEFESEEKAKTYILDQTRTYNQVFLEYADAITDEVELCKFMIEFCFTNDKFIVYRTLFLGAVPMDKIKDRFKIQFA
jgi:hypothetical protein